MNEDILKQCEDMIAKGSSSFYQAFQGLPSPRREAVYVIYAFCRMIDDSVDEPDESPYSIYELRHYFSNLDDAKGHFIWPALRWLFASFPQLDPGPFLRQMEGQLTDLVQTSYNTMAELEHYCYLVAGTVGEMLLPVLRNESNADVVASGIALGKGMQIVNIIRDVGEDSRRGRRYIPLELMVRHGYTEHALLHGEVNTSFISMIHELKQTAMIWFEKGLENVHSYPPSSGLAVELAAAFYGSILEAVEENHYDVFSRRAIVNDERKRSMYRNIATKYARVGVTEGVL